MRLIRELRNPELKCRRIGHRLGVEFRDGYRKPDFEKQEYRYYVCVAVTEERASCLRCHAPQGEWTTTKRTGLTGYSWPKPMADKFDAESELWQQTGFKAGA